jgi:hypothetical protein
MIKLFLGEHQTIWKIKDNMERPNKRKYTDGIREIVNINYRQTADTGLREDRKSV